ncbi:uncharacterized protein F5147DRAFT_658953 [Suillus discolor]|uniref:Uncharacterized protein n=1 Tax=Suillus discolor TaxID=1912936 RepID=A0A9P7ERU6_9AGAM|nr:uncharacterized protein F5147DRAFT_658953 [Suillus discolor]KAG2087447.1 hypothetical protein F5147DRAFT_658953 [Suillus discolor]
MEQFIKAIRMVQNGHVSHSPEDRSLAKEEDTSSEFLFQNGGESSMSGTETLADLDPALEFNWFMTTSHFGVGLYNEISTTRMLHAPGTSVHYFTTLHEAKEYFRLALAVWCARHHLASIQQDTKSSALQKLNFILSIIVQVCPEVWLICHQTIHNKTMEQAKSRTRWRDVVALFRTLDQLSTELGYKSGVPEARIMQSRSYRSAPERACYQVT